MSRAVLRRLGGSAAVIVAVSIAVFFAGNALAPGSAVTILIGSEGATTQQERELRHQLGLDRPLTTQYGEWALGVLHGDFGVSPISHRSGGDVLGQETPVSFELAFLALVIATLVGVPLGVLAAVWADKPLDYFVRGFSLGGFSLPVFVTGTLFVLLAAKYLPGLYSASFVPFLTNPAGNLVSMLLPAVTGAIPTAALLMQMTRGTMLDCLHQPYITMARARGVTPRSLYFVHALKNALPPIVTFQGFQFGILLGSLFVVETIFSLPGLGGGIIASINNRDYAILEDQVMVVAAAFILGNLLVDVAEPLIDPRKRAA